MLRARARAAAALSPSPPPLPRPRASHAAPPPSRPQPSPPLFRAPPQPSAAGRALIPFRDALEATRAQLQELWDGRASQLRSREAALFQLYADIGAGIEPGFAALGERYSAQRIAAYDAELRRVAAVKAARAGEIAALAGEIKDLWEELGFAARDAHEGSVARGALDELGWGLPLIAVLKGKVAALGAEKAAREEKITIMGQGITTLWKRLATPEEEQTAFLEAHAGIGDDVINAVRAGQGAQRQQAPRQWPVCV